MIKFSKYIFIYFIFSSLVIVPGLFSLVRYGLKPSIDFTGGMLIEIAPQKNISKQVITDAINGTDFGVVSILETDSKTFIIRMKGDDGKQMENVVKKIGEQTKVNIFVMRQEIVGPVLGKELLNKAIIAAIIAITGILLYVAYAFKNVAFGVSAVVALVHDLLVVIGTFSLLGHFKGVEVDTLFVTAVLTTMSFSVHDTIVVFDRIREMVKKGEKGTFAELADKALTQTMARSLANSVTIIIMLLSLVLLGGSTLFWFVLALLIGTISGAYSSPFIATPVLILWKQLEKRKK